MLHLSPIRQLQGVVEHLVSCQNKQDQTEARLAELQKQTSNLPCVFPWPGLGERRQTVEQVQALMDQTTALAPLLADVRTQVKTGQTPQLHFTYTLPIPNKVISNHFKHQ